MMNMKYFQTIACSLMLFATCAIPLSAETDVDSRKSMMSFVAEETMLLSEREVPASELGEWKDLLDSSLFLLIRKTEVYRGSIRVLVIDDASVIVRMYPDGTFVASTGLFDYIDRCLFEETAASSRRARNFDSEREAMLVPFLAPEVARFALDQQFAAWKFSHGTYIESDTNARFEADELAVVLLELAGYTGKPLSAWLNRLNEYFANYEIDIALKDYATDLSSPRARLDELAKAAEDIERITGEFTGVLSALKHGMPVKSAQESLVALAERFPGSPYIARLSAIAAHIRVLENADANEQALPVFFPIATVSSGKAGPSSASGIGNREPFLKLAKTKRASTGKDVFSGLPIISAKKPAPKNGALSSATPSSATPENVALVSAALSAYDEALAFRQESDLESSRAMLLARGGTAAGIKEALASAENAAMLESGENSFTARANWASLLFLTGTDYAKAQNLMAYLSANASAQPSPKFLDSGMPGDSRDLVLAHAIMLRLLGDSVAADAKSIEADALFDSTIQTGSIDLRRVKIGDSVDLLTERWGRPGSIVYDYYSETWAYPSLAASVIVGKSITEICVGDGSPVSPGGDIRCGDRKDVFESLFGKSAYRAGDCEVYLKDGNRVSVLYLSGRIRFMTFGL